MYAEHGYLVGETTSELSVKLGYKFRFSKNIAYEKRGLNLGLRDSASSSKKYTG